MNEDSAKMVMLIEICLSLFVRAHLSTVDIISTFILFLFFKYFILNLYIRFVALHFIHTTCFNEYLIEIQELSGEPHR